MGDTTCPLKVIERIYIADGPNPTAVFCSSLDEKIYRIFLLFLAFRLTSPLHHLPKSALPSGLHNFLKSLVKCGKMCTAPSSIVSPSRGRVNFFFCSNRLFYEVKVFFLYFLWIRISNFSSSRRGGVTNLRCCSINHREILRNPAREFGNRI